MKKERSPDDLEEIQIHEICKLKTVPKPLYTVYLLFN